MDQPTCASFLLINGNASEPCPAPVDYDGDHCTSHGGL